MSTTTRKTTSKTSASKAAARTTGNFDAQRAEQLDALHRQITDGVAALVDSEAWRAMLETAASFHTYSLGNVLLIGRQAPAATRVAGFGTWKSLGRQVRKGEKGIAILAPCSYRPQTSSSSPDSDSPQRQTPDDRGGVGTTPNTTPVAPGTEAGGGGRQVRGFRVVRVFDVAQTDGDPLPEVGPALLTGQAPSGLWDRLAAQVAGHGYALQRGDCGGANGYTDPVSRTVRVRADVDDAQAVKTLAHELGHLECGHLQDLAGSAAGSVSCRGRWEVEAESVAYIVNAAHGLDAGGYTFAYVAGWAGGELTTVRAAAETVTTTAARTILNRCTSPAAPVTVGVPDPV